jgi:hypothetical protein
VFDPLNAPWWRDPFRRKPDAVWTPPKPQPPGIPTPRGWTVAKTVGDVTCYEVRRRIPLGGTPGQMKYLSGTNRFEYHGFPPGTLNIGGMVFEPPEVTQGMFDPPLAGGGFMVYRFDYRPSGWKIPGVGLPSCDYRDLPGEDAGE